MHEVELRARRDHDHGNGVGDGVAAELRNGLEAVEPSSGQVHIDGKRQNNHGDIYPNSFGGNQFNPLLSNVDGGIGVFGSASRQTARGFLLKNHP